MFSSFITPMMSVGYLAIFLMMQPNAMQHFMEMCCFFRKDYKYNCNNTADDGSNNYSISSNIISTNNSIVVNNTMRNSIPIVKDMKGVTSDQTVNNPIHNNGANNHNSVDSDNLESKFSFRRRNEQGLSVDEPYNAQLNNYYNDFFQSNINGNLNDPQQYGGNRFQQNFLLKSSSSHNSSSYLSTSTLQKYNVNTLLFKIEFEVDNRDEEVLWSHIDESYSVHHSDKVSEDSSIRRKPTTASLRNENSESLGSKPSLLQHDRSTIQSNGTMNKTDYDGSRDIEIPSFSSPSVASSFQSNQNSFIFPVSLAGSQSTNSNFISNAVDSANENADDKEQ